MIRSFVLGAAALSSAPALAQAPLPGRPTLPRWTVSVGVAPIYAPAWQGSRDMALSIFPDIRVNYRDSVFFSVPDGLGWNAVNVDGWKAGPVIKPRFGRDEDNGGSPFLISGGSDDLRGLGNVDVAGEAGAFVQKSFGPGGRWRARGEVRQGFGGHEGIVADASFGYGARAGRLIYNVGVRTSWADRDYTNTYFGVDAAQSARSGLPASRLGSGIVSYGLNGTLIRPLGRRSSLTLLTGYERLGDDVGDSSLIRLRGRRDQVTIGLAYGLRFSWD